MRHVSTQTIPLQFHKYLMTRLTVIQIMTEVKTDQIPFLFIRLTLLPAGATRPAGEGETVKMINFVPLLGRFRVCFKTWTPPGLIKGRIPFDNE